MCDYKKIYKKKLDVHVCLRNLVSIGSEKIPLHVK